MATSYDGRRPRLSVELGRRVDAVRGDVPFNRWVERAVEGALIAVEPLEDVVARHRGESPPVRSGRVERVPVFKKPPSLPPGVVKGTAGANQLPFKCRVPSCALRTTSPNATCKAHGGKVVPNV